jgi:short-subunit dehydrogenase
VATNQNKRPNPAKRLTRPGYAVVTGAGSGIGRAIVLELARAGISCCLVGRTLTKLEAVARLASRFAVASTPLAADLGDLGSIDRLADRIRSAAPRVDVLVHSAASMAMAPVAEATLREFERLIAVNLLAPFALTKNLMPELCASQGQVVFMNSSVVNDPVAGTALYAASKHGLKGLADALRQEVNALGVRVISVYPGRTATPLQKWLAAKEGRAFHRDRLLQPGDVAAMVLKALTLPRTAEVTDILLRPARKS